MLFLNPWGLLALLSIPAILALHFFRDRRRVRRIGGLHLWEFARVSLPAGRKFDRLIRSLPLLFQILAALILSLLIAGFDIPDRLEARHFTIIADDSASMQARSKDGSSAAERAAKAVLAWAKKEDRFTLVAAGARAKLHAGPFATRPELEAALGQWQPQAAVCELEGAANLAAKFAGATGRVLYVTDDSGQAAGYTSTLETHATGEKAANAAISFADRVRIGSRKDRILATVKAYASDTREITVRASIDGQEIASKSVSVTSDQSASLNFEIENIDRPVRLELSPADALAADDAVVLAPVDVKPVKVYVDDFGELTPGFRKAVEIVPHAFVTDDPRIADLALLTTLDGPPPALRTYVFSDADTTVGQRVAQGQELLLSPRNRIVENLALEGLLWTYTPTSATLRTATSAVISHTSQPLLYVQREEDGNQQLVINLNRQATNLFRTTAWPIMVQGMIEECRHAMPGMARTNFRTGEEIPLHLKTEPALATKFALTRAGDDTAVAEYEGELPRMLQQLTPGSYSILQGEGAATKKIADFRVNLFSPGESDLRNVTPKLADFRKIRADALAQAGRNRMLYYGLLASILIFTLLAWIYQDSSH